MKRFFFLTSLVVLVNFVSQAQDLLYDSIWSYPILKYSSEIPLVDEDNVYVGADKTPIVCLDKKTGKEKWKLNVELGKYKDGFIHTIQSDNKGNIYFNGMSNDIYSVRKSDGKINWIYYTKFDDDLFTLITVLDDVIYINPYDTTFLALKANGKVLWETKLPRECIGYVIDNNEIYCQLSNGELFVLDRKSGKVINSKRVFARGRFAYPPVVLDKAILISNSEDSVVYLEKKNLTPIIIMSCMAAYMDNGNLYAFDDSTFYRINYEDQRTLWSIKGDFHWYIQPREQNGILYLQTRHRFYFIDNKKGTVLSEYPFYYKSYTKPTIENGIIYVAITGKVVAIKNPIKK